MSTDRVSQAVAARLGRNSGPRRVTGLGEVVQTGIGVLDSHQISRVRIGELVEFVGVSYSGKTQLLHQIAASKLAGCKSTKKPLICWYDLNGGLDTQRLLHLIRKTKSEALGMEIDAEHYDSIQGLLLYNPENTFSLCTSLHALMSFMGTKEGSNVDTVIIDALGMFHYEDMFLKGQLEGSANGSLRGNDEVILINVLKQLLALRSVTVFVSKMPIYEEETLPCKWPFPKAGVPCIPKEFMPGSWNSVVSHTVLIYHIDQDAMQKGEGDALRGIIALNREKNHSASRQMKVMAASTIEIKTNSVSAEDREIHFAD